MASDPMRGVPAGDHLVLMGIIAFKGRDTFVVSDKFNPVCVVYKSAPGIFNVIPKSTNNVVPVHGNTHSLADKSVW